ERLPEPLARPATRPRGVISRQRSRRAALDWSYQLLTPELQAFFARLSVFRGGFTVEAAETVGAVPGRALGYLSQLRESSLIVSDSDTSERRFRLLETLREYAAAQLTCEEGEAAARRHAEQFLALAVAANAGLRGLDPRCWLDRLGEEHDNL